jgi:hypothetical protein
MLRPVLPTCLLCPVQASEDTGSEGGGSLILSQGGKVVEELVEAKIHLVDLAGGCRAGACSSCA